MTEDHSERTWYPMEWADEVMPPGRSSPDDFLIDAEGYYFLGYALDAGDVSEYEKRALCRELDDGCVVNFICCDDLGSIDVTINPDGSYKTSGVVPEQATSFCAYGDLDTLADSLAEFVKFYFENEPPSESVSVCVAMARWSDELPHKLTITYDGTFLPKARFTAIPRTEAKQ